MVAITRYLAIFTFVVLCIPTTANATEIYNSYDNSIAGWVYSTQHPEDYFFGISYTASSTTWLGSVTIDMIWASTTDGVYGGSTDPFNAEVSLHIFTEDIVDLGGGATTSQFTLLGTSQATVVETRTDCQSPMYKCPQVFTYSTPVQLQEDQKYIFVPRPLNVLQDVNFEFSGRSFADAYWNFYSTDEWNVGTGDGIATYYNTPAGIILDTSGYDSLGGVLRKAWVSLYDSEGGSLICSSNSTVEYIACSSDTYLATYYAFATTTSTLDEYYRSSLTVSDGKGNIYNDFNNTVGVSNAPYTFLELNVTAQSQNATGTIERINACVGSNDEYYYGITAYNETCAEIIFCNGMSQADCTAQIQAQGLVPWNAPPYGGPDSCGVLFTYEWLKCHSKNALFAIITTWPFGYLTNPIIGYFEYANNASSTDPAYHFVLEFDVTNFTSGSMASTSAAFANLASDMSAKGNWDINEMANKAADLSPNLVTIVEQFILMMFYIYLAYRLLTGYWHMGQDTVFSWSKGYDQRVNAYNRDENRRRNAQESSRRFVKRAEYVDQLARKRYRDTYGKK